MANVQVTIDGRLYEKHEIYEHTGKKPDLVKHTRNVCVPVPPTEFATDDDAMTWLNDLVESHVCTYKQIVKWSLAQIPIAGHAIAFRHLKDRKSFDLADLTAAYAFHDRAVEACGPNPSPNVVMETMLKMYRDSIKVQGPTGDIMPKDIVQ